MNYFGKIFLLLFFGLGIIISCKKKAPSATTPKDDLNNVDCSTINSSYSTNVKPIIDGNCLSSGCHNSGSSNGDFTVYAGIKAKVDNGSINNRVIQQKNMPFTSSLSTEQLIKIKCWINSGAPNN